MTWTPNRRAVLGGLAAAALAPEIALARRWGRYDTILRGGTVFDGSGQRPGLRADVLVRDGIVAQIPSLVLSIATALMPQLV